MSTRKITTKAIAQSASNYTGKDGELFYDIVTNSLRISNGTTPGGVALSTGPGTVEGEYAVALGEGAAVNIYGVNLGYGAGNTAAGYTINVGWETGKFASDNYNTRIGHEAGKYGSSDSFGVAIGYQAGVTQAATSTNAVISGTSLNVGSGTGFDVGQYIDENLPGAAQGLFPGTYIASGTSPNFVLSQAAYSNGTGNLRSYGKYPGGVIINGDSGALPAANKGFYLKPVRDGGAASGMAAAGFRPCYYNPTTGEFVWASS
jgi:hypothetical protein